MAKKRLIEENVPKENEDLGMTSTVSVKLTRLELVHIRDLFSIKIPPEMNKTLSECLAEVTSRSLLETKLWQKLSKAFEEAGIPTDDDAPDYTILPIAPPAVSVFQLEPTDEQLEEEG